MKLKAIINKIAPLGIIAALLLTGFFFYQHNFMNPGVPTGQTYEEAREIERLEEVSLELDTDISRQGTTSSEFFQATREARDTIAAMEPSPRVKHALENIIAIQEDILNNRNRAGSLSDVARKIENETIKLKEYSAAAKQNNVDPADAISPLEVMGNFDNLRTLGDEHPARLALNAVGGKDIKLGASGKVCNNDRAIACAYTSGVVLLGDKYTDRDYNYYYPVMMHEYAHQIQYRNFISMHSSAGFANLFDRDIEWLADCMAASKIDGYSSGYKYECSSEQKAYALSAWDGNFK